VNIWTAVNFRSILTARRCTRIQTDRRLPWLLNLLIVGFSMVTRISGNSPDSPYIEGQTPSQDGDLHDTTFTISVSYANQGNCYLNPTGLLTVIVKWRQRANLLFIVLYTIIKLMRALWLVNQLWFIVPVNPWKFRVSSELLYKSNKLQVFVVYRLINHLWCWKNTRRIRKSLACGSSSRVFPTSRVVYRPINHRNLWSIA